MISNEFKYSFFSVDSYNVMSIPSSFAAYDFRPADDIRATENFYNKIENSTVGLALFYFRCTKQRAPDGGSGCVRYGYNRALNAV